MLTYWITFFISSRGAVYHKTDTFFHYLIVLYRHAETEMSSFWWNFHHWLHTQCSQWWNFHQNDDIYMASYCVLRSCYSITIVHSAQGLLKSWSSAIVMMKWAGRFHDDIIKWKHLPRYWPFVCGIHRWPMNSPHKGQWCRALIFFFDLCLNKRLNKQSWGWWFEMPSCSLWCHCNAYKECHGMMATKLLPGPVLTSCQFDPQE